ncbi:hypothetical protein PG985_014976 [Apiospora marii]|uniref:Uncharacterized protein n=1 Tax=Apiospora marii TaxID=335849 RepID=A0ABR1RIQ0_9PEZI
MARRPRPHKADSDDKNTKNSNRTATPQIVLGGTPVRPISTVNLASPSPFGDRYHMARRPRKVQFDDQNEKDDKENIKKGKNSIKDGETKAAGGKAKDEDGKGEAKD